MDIGQKIKTSLGECTVLYSLNNRHGNYLVLFTGDKFVIANDYIIRDDFVYWQSGDYFNSFLELALYIAEMVNKSISGKQLPK